MSEFILELKDIKKKFSDTNVLLGLNLSVCKGEFITFLGSSGCGKTTTLRIIAGLESPDTGQVILENQDVTTLEPHKRNVNTVFQNYALFPHLNVASNIAYGLRIRKVGKIEMQKRVCEILDLVQLSGFEKRMPSQLSGGQKQRVAIARALINNPKVLLLDEPLGALDLQLRHTMQLELKRLQKKLGITFIYITHDQEEAINMSDRIVVMNHGLLEQIGTPDEIYNHPKTSYVATFVGNSNIMKGTITSIDNLLATVAIGDHHMLVYIDEHTYNVGDSVTIAIRSEHITICEECTKALPGTIMEKSFTSGQLRMIILLKSGVEIVASKYGIDTEVHIGQTVCIGWNPSHAILVDEVF